MAPGVCNAIELSRFTAVKMSHAGLVPSSRFSVIPNARRCKALLDRTTDRAHIIETGTDSYHFRRTVEKHKGRAPVADSSSAPTPPEKRPK